MAATVQAEAAASLRRAPGRERAGGPGPERGAAGEWSAGVGEGMPAGARRRPTHYHRPPHPTPSRMGAALSLLTFEFEVCGWVENQDLLVLRHGPGGGRHRRDSVERGRARGGGLLAGGGDDGGAGWAELFDGTRPRLSNPYACRCVAGSVGHPLRQQLRASQLTLPHSSRRGHAPCDPRRHT